MDNQLRLWDSLRTDVRQVDQVLDQQIAQLEALANISEDTIIAGPNRDSHNSNTTTAIAVSNTSGVPGAAATSSNNANNERVTIAEAQRRFDDLHAGVESNLRHYSAQLTAMAEASAGILTATKHTERFQALYQEKRRALVRLTADFSRRRERLELLPTIAIDLQQYEEEVGVRLLNDEQNAIRHAHARVNNILEQASGTHTRLMQQRERFAAMGDKLVDIADRVPVIQTLLRRIDARRRREAVIAGTVMSIFVFLIVLFW